MIFLPRQMIQRVAQEMHIAALPFALRQYFRNRLAQPRMIIADHAHHSTQAPLF